MKAWLTNLLLKLIRANAPPTWGIRPYFMECPTCRKKPGSPDLCRECIERRNLHNLAGHLGLIEYDPNTNQNYDPEPPEKDCWCDEDECCSDCYNPAEGKSKLTRHSSGCHVMECHIGDCLLACSRDKICDCGFWPDGYRPDPAPIQEVMAIIVRWWDTGVQPSWEDRKKVRTLLTQRPRNT